VGSCHQVSVSRTLHLKGSRAPAYKCSSVLSSLVAIILSLARPIVSNTIYIACRVFRETHVPSALRLYMSSLPMQRGHASCVFRELCPCAATRTQPKCLLFFSCISGIPHLFAWLLCHGLPAPYGY
jgi:hypothetical protein